MPNKKIPQLTEVTTALLTDEMPIAVAGQAEARKITRQNLLRNAEMTQITALADTDRITVERGNPPVSNHVTMGTIKLQLNPVADYRLEAYQYDQSAALGTTPSTIPFTHFVYRVGLDAQPTSLDPFPINSDGLYEISVRVSIDNLDSGNTAHLELCFGVGSLVRAKYSKISVGGVTEMAFTARIPIGAGDGGIFLQGYLTNSDSGVVTMDTASPGTEYLHHPTWISISRIGNAIID